MGVCSSSSESELLRHRKASSCICGDGAFQMNIQELEWVKRENLPITMMVMNNHALGMIRHLQRDYFEQVYADTSEGSGLLVLQLRRGSQSLWNQQCLYGS